MMHYSILTIALAASSSALSFHHNRSEALLNRRQENPASVAIYTSAKETYTPTASSYPEYTQEVSYVPEEIYITSAESYYPAESYVAPQETYYPTESYAAPQETYPASAAAPQVSGVSNVTSSSPQEAKAFIKSSN